MISLREDRLVSFQLSETRLRLVDSTFDTRISQSRATVNVFVFVLSRIFLETISYNHFDRKRLNHWENESRMVQTVSNSDVCSVTISQLDCRIIETLCTLQCVRFKCRTSRLKYLNSLKRSQTTIHTCKENLKSSENSETVSILLSNQWITNEWNRFGIEVFKQSQTVSNYLQIKSEVIQKLSTAINSINRTFNRTLTKQLRNWSMLISKTNN